MEVAVAELYESKGKFLSKQRGKGRNNGQRYAGECSCDVAGCAVVVCLKDGSLDTWTCTQLTPFFCIGQTTATSMTGASNYSCAMLMPLILEHTRIDEKVSVATIKGMLSPYIKGMLSPYIKRRGNV